MTYNRDLVMGSLRWCVAVAVLVSGCGGYWPLRKPSGHQWTPGPDAEFVIQMPVGVSKASPLRDEHGQVTVAIAVMDREQIREAFHADLWAHRIRPLRLLIDNGSPQAYQFRKADVGIPCVSAEDASRLASVHPVVAAARWAKWAAFFLPGFLFDTLIEPASTIDFPGVHEASQWPATASRQAIREEFVRREIPDGPVPPKAQRDGVLFVRSLPPGQPIPVTLTNLETQEPVRFEVLLPPPGYRVMRSYVQPQDVVWSAAVASVRAVASWRVVSVDPARRIIAVCNTSGWFMGRSTPLTIALSGGSEAPTTVMLESAASGAPRHRTVDAFFERLDRRLPQPPPPPPAPLKPSGLEPTAPANPS